MALSLTAEQKSIYEIFSGNYIYIIPPYQRAYSWDKEQCYELYEDIYNAFKRDENEGYFLGNFVIAKSKENKNLLEVIDGQQRLITLTLLLKVLLRFDEKNIALDDAIWIKDRRNRKKKEQRVQTRVFEEKDAKFLREVLENNNINDLCKTKLNNKFKVNLCVFYEKIKTLSNEDIENFSNFLLDKVFLLPIESTDINQDKAREKALVIFETINNRGKPLDDSDIFKAKLYSMALNDSKQDEFIEKWKSLQIECENIKIKDFNILRLFRIYSYQIRAQNKIKSSEIALRDFFVKENKSPFKKKEYSEIIDDVFNILEAVKTYEKVIIEVEKYKELSKWFQLIDIYTNNYPKDTLILFILTEQNNEKWLDFSKNLVRYCYYQGSTTKIKFTMYSWMIDIINKKWKEYYPEKINEYDFEYLGQLYKGYGLLYAYLQKENKAIYPYKIKRLRDVTKYKYPNYSEYSRIGHTVVTDIEGNIIDNSKFDFKNFNEKVYKERLNDIKETFLKFFKGQI